MEHPVPPVTGYRPLSQSDVELMNAVKAKATELLALHDEIVNNAINRNNTLWADEQNAQTLLRAAEQNGNAEALMEAQQHLDQVQAEFGAFQRAEALRWASIGRSDIQKGVMALVRAVAQPDSIC